MEDQSQSEGTMEYLLQAVISRAKSAFLWARRSLSIGQFPRSSPACFGKCLAGELERVYYKIGPFRRHKDGKSSVLKRWPLIKGIDIATPKEEGPIQAWFYIIHK